MTNNKTFKVGDKVTVFDQEGEIKRVFPNDYEVEFSNTKKTYTVEAHHIKPTGSIIDRVKTFEDACRELGEYHPYVIQFNEIFDSFLDGADPKDSIDIVSYLKLRIIIAALNEGWKPNWADENEYKYYPWFVFYTQEEYDNMSEEDRGVLFGGYAYYGARAGFVCAYSNNVPSVTSASVGSRLCYKSRELAIYGAKQFGQIYADYLL